MKSFNFSTYYSFRNIFFSNFKVYALKNYRACTICVKIAMKFVVFKHRSDNCEMLNEYFNLSASCPLKILLLLLSYKQFFFSERIL